MDYLKTSPGSFDPDMLSGKPVDFVKRIIFDRAGVPYADPDKPGQPHPLRTALVYTHGSDERDCARVSDPFPPVDYTGKLDHVEDWLALIEANTRTVEQVPKSDPLTSTREVAKIEVVNNVVESLAG